MSYWFADIAHLSNDEYCREFQNRIQNNYLAQQAGVDVTDSIALNAWKRDREAAFSAAVAKVSVIDALQHLNNGGDIDEAEYHVLYMDDLIQTHEAVEGNRFYPKSKAFLTPKGKAVLEGNATKTALNITVPTKVFLTHYQTMKGFGLPAELEHVRQEVTFALVKKAIQKPFRDWVAEKQQDDSSLFSKISVNWEITDEQLRSAIINNSDQIAQPIEVFFDGDCDHLAVEFRLFIDDFNYNISSEVMDQNFKMFCITEQKAVVRHTVTI